MLSLREDLANRTEPAPFGCGRNSYFVYTCGGCCESFHDVDELRLTNEALLLYARGRLLGRFDRRDLYFASRNFIEPFQN